MVVDERSAIGTAHFIRLKIIRLRQTLKSLYENTLICQRHETLSGVGTQWTINRRLGDDGTFVTKRQLDESADKAAVIPSGITLTFGQAPHPLNELRGRANVSVAPQRQLVR